MKTLLAVMFVIAALSIGVYAQKVTLTPNKVTYTRKKPMSSYKKTFVMTYPKVKGTTPALAKKIEAALSYEKAFDFKVAEELTELQWLETATYDAVFSSGKVLSVNLNIEGSGAYPDSVTETIVVDTSNGTVQTAKMVFNDLEGLAAMVDSDMQRDIKQAIIDLRKDPEMKDPDPATLFEGKMFSETDLEGFSVDGKGVTFHFEFGFPHAIQAAEPSGYYFYRWDQIKKFLNPGGLLTPLAR